MDGEEVAAPLVFGKLAEDFVQVINVIASECRYARQVNMGEL